MQIWNVKTALLVDWRRKWPFQSFVSRKFLQRHLKVTQRKIFERNGIVAWFRDCFPNGFRSHPIVGFTADLSNQVSVKSLFDYKDICMRLTCFSQPVRGDLFVVSVRNSCIHYAIIIHTALLCNSGPRGYFISRVVSDPWCRLKGTQPLGTRLTSFILSLM